MTTLADIDAKIANDNAVMTSCLPPGKTLYEAVTKAIAKRNELWSSAGPEDEEDGDEDDWGDDDDDDDDDALIKANTAEDKRIEALKTFCTALMQGNVTAGALLASCAIWES